MDPALVQFTGFVSVTAGQQFQVAHDDGLTLIIGGIDLGFNPGPTSPVVSTATQRASCYSTSASTLCFRHLNGVSLAGLGERWPSRLVATAAEDRLSTRPRSFLPRFSVAARGYVL